MVDKDKVVKNCDTCCYSISNNGRNTSCISLGIPGGVHCYFNDDIQEWVYDSWMPVLQDQDIKGGGEKFEALTQMNTSKIDMGKPYMFYVLGGFYPALSEVAQAGTINIKNGKYTKGSWENCKPDELLDAAMRHLLQSYGEEIDKEDGVAHLSKAVWNILATRTLILKNKENEAGTQDYVKYGLL